jgi:predicted metal-dependent phosphoesterase TrpH
MLKAQLHIHAPGDLQHKLPYTAKEVIDHAAERKFDVLAFTCHDKVIHNKELEDYALEKSILLIPGVERTIEGKHVLIYNITEKESQKVVSFKSLIELKKDKELKNQPFLIIAAHPFHFSFSCLKGRIIKNLDLFDAWEYSFFYHKLINPNKKTMKLAGKYSKPLVGSSDVHRLINWGKTYSLIDSKKKIDSVFRAIKNGKVKIKTKPLSLSLFSKVFFWAIASIIKRLIKPGKYS